jgi:deoxyadenosine/deoxycytidine kinase
MLKVKYRYIAVEGNIGAGKTSLATKLSDMTGARAVLEEFAENTFLPRFYEDPERYAFPLEMSFLAARYNQMGKVFNNENKKMIISDYHFFKSRLFAEINLKENEMNLYSSFFKMASSRLPEPDLLIFLKKDVDRLQSNIMNRGREYEKGISSGYLQKLNKKYQDFIDKKSKENVLVIDSNELDFVNREDDFLSIITLINKH